MRTPLLVGALLALASVPASAAPARPAAVARPAAAPSATGLPPRFGAPEYVLGSPKAPVTVVEYLSAGCTHCAEFDAKEFPQLKARYIDTGKVRWVVRELLVGPVQLAAAGFVLARCTGQDHYWSTLEAVFRAQDGIFKTGDIRTGLLGVAHGAGLSDKQFDACVSDDAAFRDMDARSDASAKAGVHFTPTFVVDGKMYETDPLTPAVIDKALAQAAAKRGGR